MSFADDVRAMSMWADDDVDAQSARMLRQIEHNREVALDSIESMTAWAEKTSAGDSADLTEEHMERMVAVANRIMRLRAQGRI